MWKRDRIWIEWLDFLGKKSYAILFEEMEVFAMLDIAATLGASKAASTLVVLFIPSKDRSDQPINQQYWVAETLKVLGMLFGGATAFPQGRGIWRDDAQEGKLLFDEPVVIQCYTSESVLEAKVNALGEFLRRMGREAKQRELSGW